MQGIRGDVSAAASSAWQFLQNLGLNVDPPVGGRPCVRGQTGNVFRWGDGWFEPIRDGGLGWAFAKTDHSEVDARVQFLDSIFGRQRPQSHLPLHDVILSVMDG